MPSSVESGRVAKTSSRRTKSRIQSKRLLEKQKNTTTSFPEPIPLVERTNRLPLDQFISYYFALPTSENHVPSETEKLDCALDIYTANSIPVADFEACFRLIELTSSKDYSDSSVGWSPSKKRKEMKLPDMRYLVLRHGLSRIDNDHSNSNTAAETQGTATTNPAQSSSQGEMLGFLSFMVTYEDGKDVIYCYEIHLSSAAQGHGLGKLLMRRFEDIGRRIGLEKAMLTAFKSNTKALRLYERLGYLVDEYSPQPRALRNGAMKEPDYLILSKPLQEQQHPGTERDAQTQSVDK